MPIIKKRKPIVTFSIKILIKNEWVHLRKSNTEPIIRVYSESKDEASAIKFAQRIMTEIRELC